MPAAPPTPLRLLVVLPSWVGDAVMATPSLRLLRDRLPGSFLGALCRPGIDRLLRGSPLLDELHVFQPHGMMAPKRAAAVVRGRRYDAGLLLTNSFSTALAVRMAFIPRRVGYDRDGRGVLLTQRLAAPTNPDGSWRLCPAVNYYFHAACALLGIDSSLDTPPPTDAERAPLILPPSARLELACTDADHADAQQTLADAGIEQTRRVALLNPGGNNPAKRWPADRFAEIAAHLAGPHSLAVLINGSPAEADLCDDIAARARASSPAAQVVSLPRHRHTLGGLKALCARTSIMVTNDTGPRHIAAAFGVPVVSLFGPTDARWTTIPHDRERVLVADPTLPPEQSANDHPERCAVDRIPADRVRAACDALLMPRPDAP